MTTTVYNTTARKSQKGVVFAFGRDDEFAGKPTSDGGYLVFKLCENYSGSVRGGIAKTWRYVEKNMSHKDAVNLMNKRLGRKEWEHSQ